MLKQITFVAAFCTGMAFGQGTTTIASTEDSDVIYDLNEAIALSDSLNTLSDSRFSVQDRLSKQVTADTRIVTAIYYCDQKFEYCKCKGDETCVDLRYGIEYKGKLVLKPFVDNIIFLDAQRIACVYNNKMWITNLQGVPMELPVCLDNLSYYYAIEKEGKTGVVDKFLRQVVPFDYEWIGERNPVKFAYELDYEEWSDEELESYAAKKEGSYGIIDDWGQTQLPFEYNDIYPVFTKEQIIVKKNGKWGITNFEQKVLVPFIYDSVAFNGVFIGLKKEKWAFIQRDLSDYFSASFEYDAFKTAMCSNLNHFAKKGKTWGGYNDENQEVIESLYADVQIMPLENYFWDVPVVGLKLKGKWGFYYCDDDRQGIETDFLYSEIISWAYKRGEKRNENGAILMTYPLYEVIVSEKGTPKALYFGEK